MNRRTSLCTAFVATAILSGCTWVHLTPSGEKARVLGAEEINQCEKVGLTTVSVKSSVMTISRNEKKVARELENLARNAAAGLEGDTVVPASKVANGSQVFEVYKCLVGEGESEDS